MYLLLPKDSRNIILLRFRRPSTPLVPHFITQISLLSIVKAPFSTTFRTGHRTTLPACPSVRVRQSIPDFRLVLCGQKWYSGFGSDHTNHKSGYKINRRHNMICVERIIGKHNCDNSVL